MTPRKPSEGRKQEKPGQLLAAGGRFSMTVGDNLNLKVGVQVLLEEEKLALAKSLASDVTCTFWEIITNNLGISFNLVKI